MEYTYEEVAKLIDHSLLNPTLTDQGLEEGCQLALNYNVASVCIMPFYLNYYHVTATLRRVYNRKTRLCHTGLD